MAKKRKFSTEIQKSRQDVHKIRGVFQHIPGDTCQFRDPRLQFPVRIEHRVKAPGLLTSLNPHSPDLNDLILFGIQAGSFQIQRDVTVRNLNLSPNRLPRLQPYSCSQIVLHLIYCGILLIFCIQRHIFSAHTQILPSTVSFALWFNRSFSR